ncbi:6421_t:CDS:1, partial [Scutellospora calospora]
SHESEFELQKLISSYNISNMLVLIVRDTKDILANKPKKALTKEIEDIR